MSETKSSSLPESLTLQNPQNKISDSKQCFEKQISPQQFNYEGNTGQKKQEDNDYDCQFKLVVKEKFQQKLKNDSTNQFFTVIINEIIQERVKRNFVAVDTKIQKPIQQLTVTIQAQDEKAKIQTKSLSQLQKLKAQDEEVKKKIKQLMIRRPRKKALTTYELDPNRDKGFILARKMNEIKQQRQKKYILSKQESEQHKKSLFQSQLATISCVESYSVYLAQKGKNRRLRKQSQDLKLPKINLSTSFRNQTEVFKRSNDNFYDFLTQSNRSTLKQISEDGRSDNFLSIRYDSEALSARSSYDSKSKDQKRDLLREIQILRKSQKTTEKYQVKKFINDILTELIFSSVKIVESKKQFFHKAPPKPVHQMIRSFNQKDKRSARKSINKNDQFRINILSNKQVDKQKESFENDEIKKIDAKSDVQNSSKITSISRCFQINLSNKSERMKSQVSESLSENFEKPQTKIDHNKFEDFKERQKSENNQVPQEKYFESLNQDQSEIQQEN